MGRRRRGASGILAVGAFLLAACDRPADIVLDAPSDGAYLVDGGTVPVEARFEGAQSVSLYLDGQPGPVLLASPDGSFRTRVGGLAPGRHTLLAEPTGAPGTAASVDLFVDRLADSPVSGRGFSSDGEWLLTLSSASPGPGGLYQGRLSLTDVSAAFGGYHRILSENGVFADSSQGEVAWVEDWQGDAAGGTLFLSSIFGDTQAALPGVRGLQFAGATLAVIDQGLLLLRPPYTSGARLAEAVDAAGFVGPGSDLIGFVPAGTPSGTPAGYRVISAPAPAYVPTTLPPIFLLAAASNAVRREVALLGWNAGAGSGALYRYQMDTGALSAGPAGAVGVAFSPDGNFVATLAGASGQELFIAPSSPDQPFQQVPGSFLGGIYDPTSTRLAALTTGGTLLEIALSGLSVTTAATAVADFRPLEAGALLWSQVSGQTWLRTPAGSVVDLGTFNTVNPLFVFDGPLFAFNARVGTREPVRRVEVATGSYADFGQVASAPVFLADGAFGWLETRADAEPGGFANQDLWLLPALPEALAGPRAVAQRVWAGEPLPISPDGRTLLVLTGAPRRGEPWRAVAACVDEHGAYDPMGTSDPADHSLFWTADGRTAWLGPDGEESAVFFLRRCP